MSLVICAALAFSNGIIVSITRALNGRLSVYMSPFRASLWNHIIGAIVLTPFAIYSFESSTQQIQDLHLWMLMGGLLGCLFVALSSTVFSRLGALLTALLVVVGQLLFGQVIEAVIKHETPSFSQIVGSLLVVSGVILSFWSRKRGRLK
jgi:bacterial/archaeal transporter family-2 protein